MGCFCRHVLVPPIPAFEASMAVSLTAPPVVAALSAHLAARWMLPGAPAWAPDPAWLELRLPTVTLPAQTMATMMALVQARSTIMLAFGLDPLVPAQATALARIVATLNLRLPALAPLAADWRPWSALALLNGQLDTIQAALTAGLFTSVNAQASLSLAASAQSPALPAWRALLSQLLGLSPLLAIAEMLALNLGQPDAALQQLAVTIRGLRLVALPDLAMPHVVMQLIARNEAVLQLQASFGVLPFAELRVRVAAKLAAVMAGLPAGLSVRVDGSLAGMPMLLPNPSLVINAATVGAAVQMSASLLAGLNWTVPVGVALPVVSVGGTVAALVRGLVGGGVSLQGGIGPVQVGPCDTGCDAARALALLG